MLIVSNVGFFEGAVIFATVKLLTDVLNFGEEFLFNILVSGVKIMLNSLDCFGITKIENGIVLCCCHFQGKISEAPLS